MDTYLLQLLHHITCYVLNSYYDRCDGWLHLITEDFQLEPNANLWILYQALWTLSNDHEHAPTFRHVKLKWENREKTWLNEKNETLSNTELPNVLYYTHFKKGAIETRTPPMDTYTPDSPPLPNGDKDWSNNTGTPTVNSGNFSWI